MDRFWAKTKEGDNGCLLWTASFRSDGYGQFRLDGRTRGAHQVAWELMYGPIPEGLWVLHHCDTKLCVNAKHMFLGTALMNNHDARAKGRNAFGERHGRAKLTEADVRAIRADPRKVREIAEEFNVSRSLVSLIKVGKKWPHVEGALDRRRTRTAA